ncbi:MAG: hypothetical protein AABX99_00785 [Nanoarchaeota archaeon]
MYQDWDKQESQNNQRDWFIILISFALSILMQLYFSKAMSKRTKNLWVFSSIFLLITVILLFLKKGVEHPFLLGISFLFFLFIGSLAYLSSLKDCNHKKNFKSFYKTIIKEFKEIFTFIKNNWLKGFIIIIIAIIVIILISLF